MEILNKSKKMCPCCMEEHEVLVVLVQEKTVFKGVEVTYNATYEYCERCDEYNATEEMITANDIAIKNAYRNKIGLLTSDKIIAIRKKYAISQSDLCTLLAWGKKTITRYEGHQVQDAAHDKILRKLDSDPEWFLSLLEKAKNAFSEAAYEKYYQNALKLFKASKDLYLQKAVGAHYVCSEENESYGSNASSSLAKCKVAKATDEKLKSHSCKYLRNERKNSMSHNKALDGLSREQLIELLEIYSKNWLAADGIWFQSVERRLGMDEAMFHDVEMWKKFTAVEALKLKKFLGLPEQAGVEGLAKALSLRFYANINDDEISIDGNTLIYRMVDCRVQTARKRKGMEFHPCKAVGMVEYGEFARAIDSRFTCECISCYPEITDETCCCSWKFTLQEEKKNRR